jgi:iron complex transport system substrate-binding protein
MTINRRQLLLSSLSVSALALGLSACNASAREDAAGPASASASSGTEAGAFPATVAHKFGETTIPAEPKRVVTVGLKEQDDCLALGVVPVASTTWFDLDGSPVIGAWAKDALAGAAEPQVLTPTDKIEFEKVAAATPDLIIAIYSGLTQADYDKLSKIAPTVAQSKDYGDYGVPWDVQATMVGQALGRPAAMAERVAAVKKTVADAAAANPTFAGASGVVATPYEGVFVYGEQDPRSRLLTELGLTLPADLKKVIGNEFGGNVSAERVDLLDTDLVIWFVEGENRKEVDKNRAYTSLPVHREGREIFMTPGDKVYEAYSFLTVLSIDYLLQGLLPRMQNALDGDPATEADAA